MDLNTGTASSYPKKIIRKGVRLKDASATKIKWKEKRGVWGREIKRNTKTKIGVMKIYLLE